MTEAPGWSPSTLKHPRALLAGAAGLVGGAAVAQVTGCNLHEIGHAAMGSLLGWEVERVNLCLPAGGSVEYASVGRWAGNVQGYAGGFVAATFLLAIYYLVFARRARPLRGPVWWGAGLGAVIWVGPQIVIGIVEGSAGPGEDYTEWFRDFPVLSGSLIAAGIVAGVVVYTWRWRAGFAVSHPVDPGRERTKGT